MAASLVALGALLADALSRTPGVPVVVFQGTADAQTPLRDLMREPGLEGRVRLIAVPGATHSNTYRVALDSYVQVILEMLGSK
jgi:alpha-beta hydrolase superfamily lysophospholipase